MENNYQLSRIHNYVNGAMSAEDMYALECEALADPFLQDAIDGYKLQNGVNVRQLSLLQQRLATRVEAQTKSRNKYFYSWQRLAIGMTAGVMFITVCSLLILRYLPRAKDNSIKEIMISDAIYDYSVSPFFNVNDVLPVGGWDSLYEALNLSYSNPLNYVGRLHVEFEIDPDKKIINLQISDRDFQADDELMSIIRHKIKWEGNKASFYLDIHKISL